MKKIFFLAAALFVGMCASSCGDDVADEVNKGGGTSQDGDKYVAPDYKAAEAAFECVGQIIDGCVDIATEVGESKIGEPINLWNAGNQNEAVLAVESWYSFHSREDYSNNIYSIRNAYYGSRDGVVSVSSLSKLMADNNTALDRKVKSAISAAADAILDIPNPFRSNISSTEALTAQSKCAELVEVLGELRTYIENTSAVNTNAVLDPIVANYVDVVVLPTYKDLKDKNAELYDVVSAFQADPSDDNFRAVANMWLEARQPWETSEAFLFGPVDNEGLDPNMDSWPLDAPTIVQILNSGNFDYLDWTSDDDEGTVEAKQSVRGFHTLEFLAFRNGVARTLTDDNGGSAAAQDLVYNSRNAKSWGNYMKQVAYLLKKDASDLYKYWSESYQDGDSYAVRFKAHNL